MHFLAPTAVKAFDEANCVASYEGGSGESDGYVLVLECAPGFATEQDRVMVYAMGEPLVPHEKWIDSVDFEAEVWAFDAGADGDADLIIFFEREGKALTATLFDDQDGDGRVGYRLENGVPEITEGSPYWAVRVTAQDGWWTQGQTVNYNLEMEVDGSVDAIWGDRFYLDQLSRDGIVDFHISVSDWDNDGSPDFELRQAYPPEELWWVCHTWLGVAEQRQEPPNRNSTFWPYLGAGHDGFFQKYKRFVPPIQIDWEQDRVAIIVEFVPAHESDDVWYVQSFSRFGQGFGSYANFENPVGWYDLAGDKDGFPELHLRSEYYGLEDSNRWWYAPPSSLMHVRYSWDQDNDRYWDFKLGLLGRHEITSTVQFSNFTVRTVPFAQFPKWVGETVWDVALFVATDHEEFGEGIYEGSTVRLPIESYVLGASTEKPAFAVTTFDGSEDEPLPPGYRAEYSFEYGAQPHLYFSPIDRSLHLLGAERGIYRVTESGTVEYEDLDGDGYLDTWIYSEDGNLVTSVRSSHGYLILEDFTNRSVDLLTADVAHSLFESLPPANQDEWQALGDRLSIHKRDLDPTDLRGMVSQFPGNPVRIEDASIRDFRVTDLGFRFALELEAGSDTPTVLGPGVDAIVGPGAYMISLEQGKLRVRTSTPPELSLNEEQITIKPSTPRELDPVQLNLHLQNRGLEDAHEVALRLDLDGPDGVREVLTSTVQLVPGEGGTTATVSWTPPSAGHWQILAHIGDELEGDPESLRHAAVAVDINPLPQASRGQLLSLPGDRGDIGLPVALLLSSVVVTGLASFVILLRAIGLQSQTPPGQGVGAEEAGLHTGGGERRQ